jgi:hypothetical protein
MGCVQCPLLSILELRIESDFWRKRLWLVLSQHLAVPWLRRLVTGLSPRRPGFAPGSVHVGFVVDKIALRQVFLRVLRVFPVNIIPPSLYIRILYGRWTQVWRPRFRDIVLPHWHKERGNIWGGKTRKRCNSPCQDQEIPRTQRSVISASPPWCHVKWVPWDHGVARPQVVDGWEVLQVWTVPASVMN